MGYAPGKGSSVRIENLWVQGAGLAFQGLEGSEASTQDARAPQSRQCGISGQLSFSSFDFDQERIESRILGKEGKLGTYPGVIWRSTD